MSSDAKRLPYYQRYPERAKAYSANYAETHKEANRERAQRYRAEHHQEILEQERVYRETHRQLLNQRAAAYRARYPERVKESLRKSKTKLREYNHRKYLVLKAEVLNVYGGQCVCCGEGNFVFLTIDHVNNDGYRQRTRTSSFSGTTMYRWLKKNKYPQGQFQVLCWNCNCAKTHSPKEHEVIHPNAGRVNGSHPALFYL